MAEIRLKILDRASRRILAALQLDGRLSIAELSERVGLSSTPCWRRQKELEESGVIRRYVALLDREQVGLNVCLFAHVTLTRHEADAVERFEGAIRERPEVLECYELTGSADYLLKIVVPDMRGYHEFLHNVLLRIPGVATFNTSVALREVKYDVALPLPELTD
jgi:Lrp/AsnC family transcriptional regulator, leucine-responsive regulatory protein